MARTQTETRTLHFRTAGGGKPADCGAKVSIIRDRVLHPSFAGAKELADPLVCLACAAGLKPVNAVPDLFR